MDKDTYCHINLHSFIFFSGGKTCIAGKKKKKALIRVNLKIEAILELVSSNWLGCCEWGFTSSQLINFFFHQRAILILTSNCI